MSSNSRLLSKEPILSCIISKYDREEIMFSTCPQNLRKLDKWMTREEVSKTIVDEQYLKVTSSGNRKQQRPDAGPESCIWSSSFICSGRVVVWNCYLWRVNREKKLMYGRLHKNWTEYQL